MRVFSIKTSDIRLIPYLGLGADNWHGLIAHLQDEVALFECPAPVSTDKGEVLGREAEGDGLGLTGVQLYLGEVAQTLVVGHHGGYEVAGIEQHGFLASTGTGVLDIHGDGEHVVGSKLALIDLQVAILIGGVAESVAEATLSF